MKKNPFYEQRQNLQKAASLAAKVKTNAEKEFPSTVEDDSSPDKKTSKKSKKRESKKKTSAERKSKSPDKKAEDASKKQVSSSGPAKSDVKKASEAASKSAKDEKDKTNRTRSRSRSKSGSKRSRSRGSARSPRRSWSPGVDAASSRNRPRSPHRNRAGRGARSPPVVITRGGMPNIQKPLYRRGLFGRKLWVPEHGSVLRPPSASPERRGVNVQEESYWSHSGRRLASPLGDRKRIRDLSPSPKWGEDSTKKWCHDGYHELHGEVENGVFLFFLRK